MRSQFEAANARILPMSEGRVALRPGDRAELAWLTRGTIRCDFDYSLFLGLYDDIPHFAVSVEESAARTLCAEQCIELRGLRTVASLVDRDSAGIGAYARAMDLWQRNHRFCGACGAPTRVDQGGFRRRCTSCGREHFPRIDPAIIVAVTHGNCCLLGRQPTWPAGRYSVLAGFVEPGETFEAAVEREVLEESGIRVTEVDYRGSQPWPFPSSLMVGFRAVADGSAVHLGDELEDAFFISSSDLEQRVRAGELMLPPGLSISRYLIDDWLAEQGVDSREWCGGSAWRASS